MLECPTVADAHQSDAFIGSNSRRILEAPSLNPFNRLGPVISPKGPGGIGGQCPPSLNIVVRPSSKGKGVTTYQVVPVARSPRCYSLLPTETTILRTYNLYHVGAYSYLYRGSAHDDNIVMQWKYENCPPIIALLFSDDEKTVSDSPPYSLEYHYDDENLPINPPCCDDYSLRYETTSGKAIERLKSVGLDRERVISIAANALNIDRGSIEEALVVDIHEPDEVEDGKWDAEQITEELGLKGCGLVSELLILWEVLNRAPKKTKIIFDPTEVLADFETPEHLRSRDFLKEARDNLRRQLATIGAMLDFLRQPTPDAVAYTVDLVGRMSEDCILERVIVPVLRCENFENAKVIPHHGPFEFGSDILPMRRCDMGKWEYVGAQAKAKKLNSKTATEAWSQLETALSVEFQDATDNTPKRLEKMLLFLANGATPNAEKYLSGKLVGKPIKVFDSVDIAVLVLKHDLLGNLIK